MLDYILTACVASGLALACTWAVRELANVVELHDRPDGFRKLHDSPVPAVGGVAVLLAVIASLPLSAHFSGNVALLSYISSEVFWVLGLGAVAVTGIGLADDLFHLSPKVKLLALAGVAGSLYWNCIEISAVSNPFGAPYQLGWLSLPLTLLWFLGCMNAINLVDGLDGLAAGVALFAAITLALTSVLLGNTVGAFLPVALAGGLAGFLFFNFHPASIYLGDCGSLLLGFLLALIGVQSASKSQVVVALLIPIIAMGVPIADTSLAILRRFLKGIPVSASDRQHIHHKLLEMGLNHRRAVLVIYFCCILLGGSALLLAALNSLLAGGVLTIVAVASFFVLPRIGKHEVKLLKKRILRYLHHRKKSSHFRKAGYEASTRMRHATNLEELWEVFVEAAEALGLDAAAVRLVPPEALEESRERNWPAIADAHLAPIDRDEVCWRAVYPLKNGEGHHGHLCVQKRTNGVPLGSATPEMLDLLARAVAVNFERLHHPVERPLPEERAFTWVRGERTGGKTAEKASDDEVAGDDPRLEPVVVLHEEQTMQERE